MLCGAFEEYMDSAKIHGIYREKFKRLYISADGKLWPCSYIGGDRKTWNAVHIYREDIQKNVIDKYGQDFHSMNRHKEQKSQPEFQIPFHYSQQNISRN